MTYSPDWSVPLEHLEHQVFQQMFQRNPCKHWAEHLEHLEHQKKTMLSVVPENARHRGRPTTAPRRQSGPLTG